MSIIPSPCRAYGKRPAVEPPLTGARGLANSPVRPAEGRKRCVSNSGTGRKWTFVDKKGQSGKQRDRPGVAEWLARWGADLLLTVGAALVSAGVRWIYPPAGLIAAGVLLIAGGVLWARGGGEP